MLYKCPIEKQSVAITSATSNTLHGQICQKRKQNACLKLCEQLLSVQFPGLWKITWFISRVLKTCLGRTDYPSSEDEGKGTAGMSKLVRVYMLCVEPV